MNFHISPESKYGSVVETKLCTTFFLLVMVFFTKRKTVDHLTYTLQYINYLMLHKLGQRPSDVLLQSVESH